jgi:hypothetical protein
MSFNSTDITNGVSISGSTSPFDTYIKTQNAGVYNIQFSAQVDKIDGGADEIVIWLRKNGTDLTDTATTLTLSGNNDKQVAAWNWFVTSAAGDYYQIIWISADTNLRLLAEPISGTHPGIPSVIATVNRVDQFLSNTGSFSGSFTGTFTGSLLGTASYATQALSASYAPSTPAFPYTGSALITGSLSVTAGSVNALNTATYRMQGANGNTSIDWTNRQLADDNGIVSVDWRLRNLRTSAGITILNWDNVGSIGITGSLFVTGVSSLPKIQDYYANTGSSGQILASDGTNTKWTAVKNTSQIQINSEGPTVVSGSKAFKYIDNEEYITKVTIKSVYTGSIQFILRSPGIIYGSASLNNNVLYEDTTLTGWNRTIPSGSMIEFVVGTSGGISSGSASTFLFLINTISKIL